MNEWMNESRIIDQETTYVWGVKLYDIIYYSMQYFKDCNIFQEVFTEVLSVCLKNLAAYSVCSTCLDWVGFAVEGSPSICLLKVKSTFTPYYS